MLAGMSTCPRESEKKIPSIRKGHILVTFFNETVFLKGKLNCESGYKKNLCNTTDYFHRDREFCINIVLISLGATVINTQEK